MDKKTFTLSPADKKSLASDANFISRVQQALDIDKINEIAIKQGEEKLEIQAKKHSLELKVQAEKHSKDIESQRNWFMFSSSLLITIIFTVIGGAYYLFMCSQISYQVHEQNGQLIKEQIDQKFIEFQKNLKKSS